MYNIIKSVIITKNYDLSGLLKKIDTQWIQSAITNEQRAELISLAQNHANVHNSVDIMKKLEDMDKRIKVLEQANTITDGDNGETGETTAPEYEAGKWYYAGERVTFEGIEYICIAPEGQVCVWSPVEYPAYWDLVTE